MAKKRAGHERNALYGTAGSTASTQIPNLTDVDLDVPIEFNETTDRGDGSTLPKVTEQQVAIGKTPSFSLIYEDSEATITALISAAVNTTPTPVAIKLVRYSSGDTEFDGDVYLKMNAPGPLKGGMELEFECHPTDDGGRAWT